MKVKMKVKNLFTVCIVLGIILIVTTNCKKNKDDSLTSLPTLTTKPVTSILLNSAECGGDITSDGGYAITQRGICWSTNNESTISDSITKDDIGLGSYTSKMTQLIPNTKYYVRAYALNSVGISYGSIVEFTTPLFANITTEPVTLILSNSAECGGNITSDGGYAITQRGVCWSTSNEPTMKDSITKDGVGSGSYTSKMTQLIPNTKYYVRAYALNSVGVSYGSIFVFNTLSPINITTEITSFLTTSVECRGNISFDGGAAITARGVCWGKNANFTLTDSITKNGTGSGSFTSTITGLTPNTTYYVRAYATNSVGTFYGNEILFHTKAIDQAVAYDIDGNLYATVKIGTQVWMAQNLQTKRYNDGTAIPNVTGATAWGALTTPGYCWYNNDSATYGKTYGALYNWYAVNTGKLAPEGWHVATDAEWTTLENYLIANGFNYDGTTIGNKYAKALASKTGWTSDNGTGTVGNTDYPVIRNSTDFTALPGGYRFSNGTCSRISLGGFWWSSSEYGTAYAWNRSMDYSASHVGRNDYDKSFGFSVRCIKN